MLQWQHTVPAKPNHCKHNVSQCKGDSLVHERKSFQHATNDRFYMEEHAILLLLCRGTYLCEYATLSQFMRVNADASSERICTPEFYAQGIMSFGDSSAVFEQRSKAIGLEAGVVQCFKDANLDTMAKFAFACNFSPGGSDDAPLKKLITA